MFWPGQAGAAEPSRWAFLAVATPSLLFVTRIRPGTTHWLIAALLSWAAITMLWADVWYDAVNELYQLVLMGALFCVAYEIEEPEWLYRGLSAGLGASTVIAIIQKLGYDPVISVLPPGSHGTPSGLFVNPSLLGEATVPIVVLMLVRRDWLFALIPLPALILSEQRSSILALGLCFTAWAILERRKWLWLVLAIGYAPVVYLAATKSVLGFTWDSIYQRWAMYQGIVSGLTWFGHGVGQFYADFPMYSSKLESIPSAVWVLTAHAHNDFLEFVFELGLPGIVLIFAIVWQIYRRAPRGEGFALAAIAITGLVGFPLFEPFTAAMAALLAGCAVGAGRMVGRTELHGRPALYGGFQRIEVERTA